MRSCLLVNAQKKEVWKYGDVEMEGQISSVRTDRKLDKSTLTAALTPSLSLSKVTLYIPSH